MFGAAQRGRAVQERDANPRTAFTSRYAQPVVLVFLTARFDVCGVNAPLPA